MVFGFLQHVHCFKYVYGLILLLVVNVVHNTLMLKTWIRSCSISIEHIMVIGWKLCIILPSSFVSETSCSK